MWILYGAEPNWISSTHTMKKKPNAHLHRNPMNREDNSPEMTHFYRKSNFVFTASIICFFSLVEKAILFLVSPSFIYYFTCMQNEHLNIESLDSCWSIHVEWMFSKLFIIDYLQVIIKRPQSNVWFMQWNDTHFFSIPLGAVCVYKCDVYE